MDDRITRTIDEMAARTGLSRSFLYLEMKRGKLATIKIGKCRRVHVEDEAAYLRAHRQTARAA